MAIETGLDTNGNGVLDDSEVTATTYDCTERALIRVVPEPPGANCVDGGTAVQAGLDANGDGVLDAIEVTTTSYVCVPPSQLQHLVRVDPFTGGTCPNGGDEIQIGYDLDGNGVLDSKEVSSVTFVCAGATTLVRVDTEPPGSNCTAGGSAIRIGIDTNSDQILEDGEVQTTSYVCKPSSIIAGDVIVHTQVDLDALAGITQITGSLIIESTTVTAVTLPDLEAVGGTLGCNPGPCSVTSYDLPALRTVGTFVNAGSTLSLLLLTNGNVQAGLVSSVSLPSFQRGTFAASGDHLALSLPELSSGDVTLNGQFASIDLPAFATGSLDMFVIYGGPPTITFPAFTQATGPGVYLSAVASDVSLPALVSTTHLKVDSFQGHVFDVPVLATISKDMEFWNDQFLSTCALEALWERTNYPPASISGTDDSATCP